MLKTFAFALYILFNDGTQQKFLIDEHVSAVRCAEMLTDATSEPIQVNKELVKEVIVACEEEEENTNS